MEKLTDKDIEQELLKGISAIVSRDNLDITPETSMVALGIDSLKLVEIFVFIEKNFNLQLLESGIAKQDLESIKSLASYVHSRIVSAQGKQGS